METLAQEGARQVAAQGPWLLAAAAVALGLMALERRIGTGRGGRWLHAAVLGASTMGMLWLAWGKAWLGDDAFISFRYAQNLARGEGLVFNPGEWVEGYTNFLWTAGLGLLAKLGADIPLTALGGNLAAAAATLWVVAASARRGAGGSVPFAALSLGLGYTFTTWATSGLETMPAALAVAAAGYLLTRDGARWEVATGLALAAAALMRPDHVLFALAAGAALVLEDVADRRLLPLRPRLPRLLRVGLPFAAVYGAYFLLRWQAYGDRFPNTYYAKSGGSAYVEQGLVYLAAFAATSGAWAWAWLGPLAGSWRQLSTPARRYVLFAALACLGYGAYVVRVGGDFMLNRFFVSVLPLAAVALEVGLRHRLARPDTPARMRTLAAAAGAACVATAVVQVPLVGPGQKRWHLAAEETFYKVTQVRPLRVESPYFDIGQQLAARFHARGLHPRFAVDCVGMVAFYGQLPLVDRFGLTNRRIAHKPLSGRGRPGHEKWGDTGDLLAERAVLSKDPVWPGYDAATRLRVDGGTYYLVQWDDDFIRALREAVPGVAVPDPARGIQRALSLSAWSERAAALRFFEAFLAHAGSRDAWLQPLRASVRPFPLAPATQEGFQGSARLERRTPDGATFEEALVTEDAGETRRGTARVELGPVEAAELRAFLAAPPGARVRVEVASGGSVACQFPLPPSGMGPSRCALGGGRGEPAVLWVRDEDERPGMGVRLEGLHAPAAEEDVTVRLASGKASATLLRAALEELGPDAPELQGLPGSAWHREDFEQSAFPAASTVSGKAFGAGPVRGALPAQAAISGQSGTWLLNSFHGGDGARGRLSLPLSGRGSVSVRVGGGGDCQRTYVGVEVDGEVVTRVCGRNDEALRPESLAYRVPEGARGALVFVDDADGPWGHLLADDVWVVGQ
jgi:hypothetical protein